MPYRNVPEHLWEKMDRCVNQIKGKNRRTGKPYTKGQKVAICHAQLVKGSEIEDMIGRGIPQYEAQMRWALKFHRMHGFLPHQLIESVEDLGYTYDHTVAETLVATRTDEELTNTNNHKLESMTQGSEIVFQEMTLPLRAFEIGDDNTLTMIATRDGAKAYHKTGVAVTWKKGVLERIAGSWVGGRVGANHEPSIDEGKILISRYENPYLYHTVVISDELKGNVERNKGFVGVSIEATNVEIDHENLEILDAKGTGVTFVFYPKKPACTEDDGCGIIGEEPGEDQESFFLEPDEKNYWCPEVLAWCEKNDIIAAKLTYQQRKALPGSAFCGPDRSFPAHDAAHVRNGLARLPQSKFSSGQKAKIKACLARRAKRYGITVSTTKGEKMSKDEATNASVEELTEKVTSLEEQLKSITAERDELKEFKVGILNERKAKIVEEIRKLTGTSDEDGLDKMEVEALEMFLKNLEAAKNKAEEEKEEDSGAQATKPTQEKVKTEEELLNEDLEAMKKIELAHTGANVHGKVIDTTGAEPIKETKPEVEQEEKGES